MLKYSVLFWLQIAKLSRSLRVPGDAGGRGSTERKPVQNLNDFVKTDTQPTPNPVSSTTDETEQQNQESLENDLEEGGLC